MKKSFLYLFLVVFAALTIVACQKEVSFETPGPATATFAIDSTTGDCATGIVSGSVVAGRPLADSNYIEVAINVTTPGSYIIETTAPNGYSYKGSGVFTNTGTTLVKLKGTGTPLQSGVNDLTVSFGPSVCTVVVTVLPGSVTGPPAAFTLTGAPNTCGNPQLSGVFAKGVLLTNSSRVVLNVEVSTVGTYRVSTDTVNGYSFAGSGTFTTIGANTIMLTASGTPVTDGLNKFKVTAGTSICTFDVTVTATAPPPPTSTGVYFPLTQGSWWSYDDGAGTTDSFSITVNGTETINNKIYQRFIDPDFGDTTLYRKDEATGFYYAYSSAEDFLAGGPITFSQPGFEIVFLKENLTTGATWNSDLTGTSSGFPTTLRFKNTCVNANASITVNGKAFTNVYQVDVESQISVSGSPFAPITKVNTYYAKGVGLIKVVSPAGEQHIRNWKVN